MADQIRPGQEGAQGSEEADILAQIERIAYTQGHPDDLAATVEKLATKEPPEGATKTEEPAESNEGSAFDQLGKRDTQTRKLEGRIASKMEELGYDQQTVSELSSKLAAGEFIPPNKLSLARQILQQSNIKYREIDIPSLPGGKRFEVVQGEDDTPAIAEEADEVPSKQPDEAGQLPEPAKEEPVKIDQQFGFLGELLEDEDGAYQIGTQNPASQQSIRFALENPNIFTVSDGENGQKIIAFTPEGKALLQQKLKELEGQLGNTPDNERKRSSLSQIQEKLQFTFDQEQRTAIPLSPEQRAQKAINELRDEAMNQFSRESGQSRAVFMITPDKLPEVSEGPYDFNIFLKEFVRRAKESGLKDTIQLPTKNRAQDISNDTDWKDLASFYNLLANHRNELEAAGITLGDPSIDRFKTAAGEAYNFGVMITIDQDKLSKYPNAEPEPQQAAQEPEPQAQLEGQYDPQAAVNMGNDIAKALAETGGALTQTDQALVNRARTGNPLTIEELLHLARIQGQLQVNAEAPQDLPEPTIPNINRTVVNQEGQQEEPAFKRIERALEKTPTKTTMDDLVIINEKSVQYYIDEEREIDREVASTTRSIRTRLNNALVDANSKALSQERASQARGANFSAEQYASARRIVELLQPVLRAQGEEFLTQLEDVAGNNQLLDQVGITSETIQRTIDSVRDAEERKKRIKDKEKAARTAISDPEGHKREIRANARRLMQERVRDLQNNNETSNLTPIELQNRVLGEIFTSEVFQNGLTLEEQEFRDIMKDVLPTAQKADRDKLVSSAADAYRAAEADAKSRGLKGEEYTRAIEAATENAVLSVGDTTTRKEIIAAAKAKVEKDQTGRRDKLQTRLRRRTNQIRAEIMQQLGNSSIDEGILEARIIQRIKEEAENTEDSANKELQDLKELFDIGQGEDLVREIIGGRDRARYITRVFQEAFAKNDQLEPNQKVSNSRVIEDVLSRLTNTKTGEGFDIGEVEITISRNAFMFGFKQREVLNHVMRFENPTKPISSLDTLISEAEAEEVDQKLREMKIDLESVLPNDYVNLKYWGEVLSNINKIMKLPTGKRAAILAGLGAALGGMVVLSGGSILFIPALATTGVAYNLEEAIRRGLFDKNLAERKKELVKGEQKAERLNKLSQDKDLIMETYKDAVYFAMGQPFPERGARTPQARARKMMMVEALGKKYGFGFGEGNPENVTNAFLEMTGEYRGLLSNLRNRVTKFNNDLQTSRLAGPTVFEGAA